jgi:hypothetical protein
MKNKVIGTARSILFGSLLFAVTSNIAVRADIEELQALSFGKLVVLNNDEIETLRIDKAGNLSYSDVFRVINPPQRARFRAFNLPANTPLNVSSVILQSTLATDRPNLQRFTFDELDHLGVIITDETGEASIWVGGQISTSGEGPILYGDSVPFTADYRLTIDF